MRFISDVMCIDILRRHRVNDRRANFDVEQAVTPEKTYALQQEGDVVWRLSRQFFISTGAVAVHTTDRLRRSWAFSFHEVDEGSQRRRDKLPAWVI